MHIVVRIKQSSDPPPDRVVGKETGAGRPPTIVQLILLPPIATSTPAATSLTLSKLLLPQSVATVHVVQVMFLPPPTATGPCNLVFVPAYYNNIGKAGHPSFLNMLRP